MCKHCNITAKAAVVHFAASVLLRLWDAGTGDGEHVLVTSVVPGLPGIPQHTIYPKGHAQNARNTTRQNRVRLPSSRISTGALVQGLVRLLALASMMQLI